MANDLTTIIIARNAQDTIGRAIKSVQDAGTGWPILLVDDWSDDNTVSIARDIGGDQVTVIKPDVHIGTGNARQTGLDHVQTKYAVWLDADDVIKPQRNETVLRTLVDQNADMVVHEADLIDGYSEKFINSLKIPDFLMHENGLDWQLERNWLPILCPAVKIESAKSVQYNIQFKACEDYDHFLRCMLDDQNIILLQDSLLNYHAYSHSISREKSEHKNALKQIYADDLSLSDKFGSDLSGNEKFWILASRKLFLGHWNDALKFLHQITDDDVNIVLPYNRTIQHIKFYGLAICYTLLCDFKKAELYFHKAMEKDGLYPDLYNNFASMLGMRGDFNACFKALEKAESLNVEYRESASYFDLEYNWTAYKIKNKDRFKLTIHPLRYHHTRSEY